MKRQKKQIYLDGAANSPLDKKVIGAMKPYIKAGFCGNSNSAHWYGAVSDGAVEKARDQIAKALGGIPKDQVLFTSGATESNNWVIKSLALSQLSLPEDERRTDIVCSAGEHASVINACESLKPLGFRIRYVPLGNDGHTCPSLFKSRITRNTLLVCLMAVNNETGVENDAEKVAFFSHQKGAKILIDATQAFSKGGKSMDITERFPRYDFVSLSSHKLYGPTGVGALIAKTKSELIPLMDGGSQESGLRGGTHNVAAIVGFGKAMELMSQNDFSKHFSRLVDRLTDDMVSFNSRSGDSRKVWYNVYPEKGTSIVNLYVKGGSGYPNMAEALASVGVACSAGAACSASSEGQEPSHVLKAMDMSNERISDSFRLSFTKFTTIDDIDGFVERLAELLARTAVEQTEESRNGK